MATTPRVQTTVQDTATAKAGGQDLICVLAPVPSSADITPRLFGSASAIYGQHGFNEGVEYSALHVRETGKPVLFVGLPIATPGAVGRVNTAGNTGTSVVTAVAGGSGVLGEHEGRVKVVTGGTIGTDQIVLDVSLDDGRFYKRVRLSTASSYTIPFVGVTLNFAAGTLVAGDTVITWFGSAPRASSADITTARNTLAGMLRFFRSVLLVGDLQNSTEALAFNTELDAYASQNDRFIFGRAAIKDRLPFARMSATSVRMTGAPSVTYATTSATRAAGSFLSDGFANGDYFTVSGSTSNNGTKLITAISGTVLTFASGGVAETTANSSIVAYPGLVFTTTTAARSRGSWLDDGFRIGDVVTFAGTVSNNGSKTLTNVTATTLTWASGGVSESISAQSVTVTAGQTKAAWVASSDAAFSTVDAKKRLDLSIGRGRIKSAFSDYWYRRPAAWDASIREYQHDLHIPTWRKSDGPVLADLFDTAGNLVEYDDRVDGGAASQARFTSYRTWANGPAGAFISQSVTREVDSSLLSQTHNMAVTNVACTVVQLNAELAIGQVLVLKADGTATEDSLKTIEKRVNDALEAELLQNKKGEGQRASKAVWTASRDDLLNTPSAVLTGVCQLVLNGTIHDVITNVKVQ